LEQAALDPAQTRHSPASAAANQMIGNLLSSQSELVSEDLASFLVAHHILISGNDSIASIKEYFRNTPDILEIVDELMNSLEQSNLISMTGDKIKVAQRFVDIGGNVENLRRFLPRLFKLSTDRVLSDAEAGTLKEKKEALRYFALPNDKETSLEAQAIYLEFKTKMLNLISKAEREARKAESIRLVGLFNCALVPEDFV